MPVTIIFNNQNLKLVSTRKDLVERWETVSLPAGLVKDGRVLDPAALAGVIDGLFTSLNLPRGEVIASITGISFIYRILTLPAMKEAARREAIERATQKEIKVPLEELYLDWQVFAEDDKEIGVFVLGIPRVVIEALVKSMVLARVNLVKVDIKALALARAVNQPDALIVDFESEWFDIAIVSRGVPVTLHTVAPKSQSASLDDNIQQLKDEIERTVDFFNLTHKESPVPISAPVILTGSLAADPQVAGLVESRLERPQQEMVLSRSVPLNFPWRLYADNLGLVLKNGRRPDPKKHAPERFLDINVDPLSGRKREMARPFSAGKAIALIAAFAVVVLIVALSLQRHQTAAELKHLQTESGRIDRSLLQARMALDQASVTETRIQALNEETLALQKEREMISGKGAISSIFEYLTGSLPSGAYYSQVTSSPTGIVLEGRAALRADVIDYAGGLTQSGRFSEIRLALIEEESGITPEGTGPGYIFRIVIKR